MTDVSTRHRPAHPRASQRSMREVFARAAHNYRLERRSRSGEDPDEHRPDPRGGAA